MRNAEGENKVIESQAPNKTRLLYKPIVQILLIVVTGLIAYSNTFRVPFQFDDYNYIIDNHKLRDLSNLWPPTGSRWAGFLTFALNYKFGGLSVTDYHIVNIIIHIINALLVYRLVLLTFQTPYFNLHPSTFNPRPSLIALFSSLLFVSHPVQTQAVTYIVQRFTSTAVMFYLLSLVMYVKFRTQNTEHRTQSTDKRQKIFSLSSVFWYLGSVLSAVLAMKTKEIAFTLPFIIVLYEFSFFTLNSECKIPPHPPLSKGGWGDFYSLRLIPYALRFLYLTPFLLTLIIIPLNFIGHEWEIYKPALDTEEKLRQLQLKDLAVLSKYEYLLTQFRVIVTYLRLLFLPINQNLDYDYPVYHSFFEPNVFLSFMFLLFVFGLGVYLFYCSKTKQQTPDTQAEAPYQVRGRLCGYAERLTPHVLRLTPYLLRLTAFGLFWFFITLSIESSIIPLKDVIFEHRLYLPSIGLIIAFVSVAFYFIPYLSSLIFQPSTFNPQPSSSPSHHSSRLSLTTCYLLLTTAVIVFSIAAYERNTIWKSDISLWEDVVRKSPNKEGGYLNLGLAYLSQGLTDKAIKCFLFASQLKPEFPDSYINLGLSYYTQGAFAKAIEYYQTALRLNPESPHIIHNNIGTAYDSMGLISNSIEHYEIALKLNPDFAEPYINLGIIYHSQGLIDKAIESYQIALKLNPDSSEAHYNMGISYSLKGLTDNAIKHLENSLTLKPDFAKAHYYLGVEYRKKGLIDKAEEHFRIADKLGYTN